MSNDNYISIKVRASHSDENCCILQSFVWKFCWNLKYDLLEHNVWVKKFLEIPYRDYMYIHR